MNLEYSMKAKKWIMQSACMVIAIATPVFASAQETSADEKKTLLESHGFEISIGLLMLFAIIALFAIVAMGMKLYNMSLNSVAKELGEDPDQIRSTIQIFPALVGKVGKKNKVIKLKEGKQITIKGTATSEIKAIQSHTFSIRPTDFRGMMPIPQVEVEEGAHVKAGQILFFDKKNPSVKYSSPVSGQFIELKRGPKRRIDELVILADANQEFVQYAALNVLTATSEEILNRFVESGALPLIRQRPYNVVPEIQVTPKNIHISCFDSAPLPVNVQAALDRNMEAFQAGVIALSKLTSGKVYLGANADLDNTVLHEISHAEVVEFKGVHPAGNVGVQIHHIDPINKDEVVWTVDPQNVIILGRLCLEGKYDTRKLFAIGGSSLKSTFHVELPMGANVEQALVNNLEHENVRVISGNVLSGNTIDKKGHIGFFNSSISVIEEGDQEEFFGWLMPSYPRPTASPTFFSFFHPGEELAVNTNTHGEERAFVVTGRYEEVIPMDILPMQLCKAILAEDFERMEGLGLYEVVEEDLALCEFVCPSKTPIQEIISEGIELLRKG